MPFDAQCNFLFVINSAVLRKHSSKKYVFRHEIYAAKTSLLEKLCHDDLVSRNSFQFELLLRISSTFNVRFQTREIVVHREYNNSGEHLVEG